MPNLKQFSSGSLKNLIIICFLLMMIGLSGCSEAIEEPGEQAEENLFSISSYTVENSRFTPIINLSGTLKAKSETTIAAEASGIVENIFVKEGDAINVNNTLLNMNTNESGVLVELQSAQTALNNAETLYQLTQKSIENNSKQAILSVEQSEVVLETAKKTNTSTATSVDEQILSAKAALEIAKTNLEISQKNLTDVQENLIKSETDLVESAINALNMTMVVFSDALAASDSILGVSDKHRQDNDYFEAYLSVKDPTILVKANLVLKGLNGRFANFQQTYENIRNISTIEEINQSIGENNFQAVVQMGDEIRELLKLVNAILQHTITAADFSIGQLDALKSRISGMQTGLEGQLAAFTSISQALSDFDIQNVQTISNLELAVKAAEKQLTQSEHNLANLKAGLNVQTVGTASQVDIAEKNVQSAKLALENVQKQNDLAIQNAKIAKDSAKSRLDAAKLAIAKMTVTSPIKGVITDIFVEKGEMINMGSPLFKIVDIDVLVMETYIESELIANIIRNLPVKIILSDDRNIKGRITNIDSQVDTATRRVRMEIEVDNQKRALFANTFVEAEITMRSRNTILIPLLSVFTKNPPTVFVVDPFEYIVQKREVVLGEQNNGMVEILDGLQIDEIIVAEKVIGLEAGNKIRFKSEEDADLSNQQEEQDSQSGSVDQVDSLETPVDATDEVL